MCVPTSVEPPIFFLGGFTLIAPAYARMLSAKMDGHPWATIQKVILGDFRSSGLKSSSHPNSLPSAAFSVPSISQISFASKSNFLCSPTARNKTSLSLNSSADIESLFRRYYFSEIHFHPTVLEAHQTDRVARQQAAQPKKKMPLVDLQDRRLFLFCRCVVIAHDVLRSN